MLIAVSACLLGENCKYNGSNNYNEALASFLQGNEVIAVCPEVMGGLPVPREPAEIVGGVVRCRDGALLYCVIDSKTSSRILQCFQKETFSESSGS